MDTTGDLITISLATIQQELGLSSPVLSLSFDSYAYLTSSSWIKEVWRFLQSICGTLQFSSQWTPVPSYAEDINIMEIVMTWDIPNSKKNVINLCWLFNKVYYVGELYESNGTRIKPNILQFDGTNYHDDKCPSMLLPPKYKEYWVYAINRIRSDCPPASKLGKLLHAKSFKYRMSNDMRHIFEYSKGARSKTYTIIPSTLKEFSYMLIHNHQHRFMEQNDSFAVTIASSDVHNIVTLKHYKSVEPIPLPSIFHSQYKLNAIIQSTSELEMKAFDTILQTYDASIIRNVGKLSSTKHIRQLALALKEGRLIGVGDASVNDYKIGHAYNLETKPPQFHIRGVAPVDCVEEDQTSNRGESFTILALCTIVNVLCKVYNIQEGSVVMYCDNKEALRRKDTHKSTFTTLSRRDIDVKMSVEHMIQTVPITFSFQHVPGHADDDPSFNYGQAPQQVQRNIDMHNLVTAFMHSPPSFYHPTTATPFLPHQKIALMMHGQVIAGDIQSHIFLQRYGMNMEERLEAKRDIKHTHQHIIDWQALHLAFKQQDTLGKINATKILHSLWPTMLTLKDRNTGVSGLCPRCKRNQETIQHVFQCETRPAVSAFRESIHLFRKQLVKLKTAKPIALALVELLVAFGQNRTPICPAFSYGDRQKYKMLVIIFNKQLLLGPNSLHAGYFSYKWSMLQSTYVIRSKSRPIFDIS